jgi:hypothetical protein
MYVCPQAPADYEGVDFHTRALQHSKVQLTRDDDEPHRAKTLKQKFNADQVFCFCLYVFFVPLTVH